MDFIVSTKSLSSEGKVCCLYLYVNRQSTFSLRYIMQPLLEPPLYEMDQARSVRREGMYVIMLREKAENGIACSKVVTQETKYSIMVTTLFIVTSVASRVYNVAANNVPIKRILKQHKIFYRIPRQCEQIILNRICNFNSKRRRKETKNGWIVVSEKDSFSLHNVSNNIWL